MIRLPLCWRLFTAFGLLIVSCLGLFALVGGAWMEQAVLDTVEERLRGKAVLLQSLLRAEDVDVLQTRLNVLHDQLGTRITLIDPAGKVVGDTDCNDVALLDNHGHRPEILSARIGSFGTSKRYSSTTAQDMMYVARRVGDTDSRVAFVRVALPFSVIHKDIRGARSGVWIAAALAASLALFVAWRIVRSVTDPLEQLSKTAAAVASGNYGRSIHFDRRDEFASIAAAFNQMSASLEQQRAEIRQKRRQLRALLDCMAEGVIAIDAHSKVSFINERAGVLFGIGPEAAPGRSLWEIVRHQPVHDLLDRLQNREVESCQLGPLTISNRVCTVHGARLQADEQVGGMVLVFQDVTELTRFERIRQDFSHELRTPLAVIAASVETLQHGAVDDPANRGRFLEHIASHTQRLSAAIMDLLARNR